MRYFRPSILLSLFYHKAVFRVPVSINKVYLTFDDGPTPGKTERILSILEQYRVPATFFLTGRNIHASPDLAQKILQRGFSIGNHGYDHIRGTSTGFRKYIADVKEGEKYSGSIFFRPPYGAIGPCQYYWLRKRYRIVFWDLMPYDFDNSMDKEQVLKIIKKHLRPGSLIVLHDNSKSNVQDLLGDIIELCWSEGYSFGELFEDLIKAS